MASQLNFDQLKAQIEKAGLSTAAFEAEFNKLKNTGGDVNKLLKTMNATLDGIQDTGQDIVGTFSDLSAQLRANLAELGKTNSALSVSKKAYQGITSVVDKLKNEEQGIYDFNVKQLKSLQEKAKVGYDDLRRSVQQLSAEERATEAGQAMLRAKIAGYQAEKEALVAIEKRLDLEKKVEKVIGATGALIEGSSKLLATMGFGHLSSELSELNDKLKSELRDELKEAGDEANKLALSFKYMGKGLAGSAKIFADGLTDPLFIVGKVLDTYLEINKASVDLQRLTGQNAVKFENIGANAATLKDTLETMSELTLRTGKNAQNIFSSKVIGQAAALKTTMGLTAEEAGGIAIMSQTSGKAVDDITDSVVATTSAFNGANRSAVSQGQVLRDVANTADSIKLSLGNNDVAIAKAASAARRLGMDLGRVDEIAGSLMNFEDSIGKELEAELLIGKELNLEKARELALNNDLAGLSEELFKNSSDIAEFGKMNRIQQESYAAALGMTKDELAKIAYQKALDNNMTEEQAAKAAGVNAEEMKRVDIQQNFAKALEKIAGALAPILDIVGDILSMPLVPYLILGAAAVSKIGGGLIGTVRSMGSLARSALDFVKNLNMKGVGEFFSGLKDKFGQLKGAFGEGAGDMVRSKSGKLFSKDSPQGKMIANLSGKAGEKAESLADKATEAGKKVPEKTGGGMSSLTESIQKIKPTQILAGAAALVLVAGAVYIFAKAAQEFATVSWEDMAKAGVGLLGLVAALAAVGAIMMSGVGALAILAGAAAIVIMAGGLFILGKALQEVGEGMQMMEPALSLVASIGDKAMGLMTVGASLMGIAAGLREIASAGTGAIPVLDKINALAGGGNKSVGGAKGKEEGTMAALEAKFDTLIALVKQGTTINLDGSKIATSVNRNLPRVQTASS